MRRVNYCITVLSKNERPDYELITLQDAVIKEISVNEYKVIKDRYGYLSMLKGNSR